MDLLAEVDVAPRQVMIEVKVIDTSPEDAEQLGLAYSYSPLGLLEVPPGTQVTQSPLQNSPLATVASQFGTFSKLPLGLSATFNALTTHSESKILANPRIQVLDNDSASIFIGQTINVQLSNSGLTGSTLTVQQFPVGIILLVRPRVNADGKITMLVHPVVSTVTSTNSDGLPQTSSREAETTIMVNDGETVVIGGLIQDEMTKEVDSVPFLSKLPLIGELFKNRSKDHSHTEVMVFITPHILKDVAAK
jgi:type II secretory pathway component GspD/PulD (secretin)